jgi:transcriptional regulator with XRE-family HTH domain
MKFGEFLRIKRLENNFSLRKMARVTDIDVAYLSRIERTAKPPEKKRIINKIINAIILKFLLNL